MSAATTPTISVGTARTLTGQIIPRDDARMSFPGFVPSVVTISSSSWVQNLLGNTGNVGAVEFQHYGAAVEVPFRIPQTNSVQWKIKVDGVYLNPTTPITDTHTAGTQVFLLIAFPSVALRTITVEFYLGQFGGGDSTGGKGGVGVATADSIFAAAPRRGRALWVGDSITQGATTTDPWHAYPFEASRRLGYDDVGVDAIAGTGYINTGSGQVNIQTRLAANVAAFQPDVIVFAAGINDNAINGAGYDQAGVTAAFNASVALAVANAPKALIYASSALPARTDDTNRTNVLAVMAWLQAAAAANTSVKGVVDTTTWITTAAQDTAFITVGGPHTNDTGAAYYARRFSQAIRAFRTSVGGN